jgi:hypothetical protein
MMKKFVFIMTIVTSTTLATQAQEGKSDSWPYWTISKDVQRTRFKDVRFEPAQIRSGNADWAISKGVHRVKPAPATSTGKVAMSGYPTWTISKGVARWQAERKK